MQTETKPKAKATRTQQPQFETREYTRNHGAEPRGRGSWAFIFADSLDQLRTRQAAGNYLDFVWFAPGSLNYGDAKKLATVEAKARGASWVGVCA